MAERVAVLVESNTTGNGRVFVGRCRQLGLRPVLLTSAPERYDYIAADHVDTVVVDTTDHAAMVAVSRAWPVALVASSSEYFVVAAARLSAALHLPGPDPEALARCRDKRVQRRVMAEADVPVPAHRSADTADAAREAALVLGFPVVVKPVSGSGSVGVRLCSDPASVYAHAAALLARTGDERGATRPASVLVEQFVTGDEVSVEILEGTLIGVTGTRLGRPPSFVEIGHDHPAPLNEADQDAVVSAAFAALAALDLERATAHVEVRVEHGRATVIEVNPRLPGGGITDLVRLATGVDLVTEFLKARAGLGVRTEPSHRRAASLRFVVPARAGRIASVHGLAAAKAAAGVVEAAVRPVRDVRPQGDFRDRIGHVIAIGADVRAAAQSAAAALAAISLRMEADDERTVVQHTPA
jgi:biotin carboxylase